MAQQDHLDVVRTDLEAAAAVAAVEAKNWRFASEAVGNRFCRGSQTGQEEVGENAADDLVHDAFENGTEEVEKEEVEVVVLEAPAVGKHEQVLVLGVC